MNNFVLQNSSGIILYDLEKKLLSFKSPGENFILNNLSFWMQDNQSISKESNFEFDQKAFVETNELNFSYNLNKNSESKFYLKVIDSDDHFTFIGGVSCQSSSLRYISPLSGDLKTKNKTLFLTNAYCGAHTGSPLSKSNIFQQQDEAQISWWSGSFVDDSNGESLLLGFSSCEQHIGKIETRGNEIQCLNYIDNNKKEEGIVWSEPLSLIWHKNLHEAQEILNKQLSSHADLLKKQPIPYGWGSWAHYDTIINDSIVIKNAKLLKSQTPLMGQLKLIQIDDGWQKNLPSGFSDSSWKFPPIFLMICLL